MKVLDSFAWFEYFAGTRKGGVVDEILRSDEDIATPASCLAEIKRKRKREGGRFEQQLRFIRAHSQVLPLTAEIALRAGDIDELHFADALIYATALEHSATVVTGDVHFKGLPRVLLLKD